MSFRKSKASSDEAGLGVEAGLEVGAITPRGRRIRFSSWWRRNSGYINENVPLLAFVSAMAVSWPWRPARKALDGVVFPVWG